MKTERYVTLYTAVCSGIGFAAAALFAGAAWHYLSARHWISGGVLIWLACSTAFVAGWILWHDSVPVQHDP